MQHEETTLVPVNLQSWMDLTSLESAESYLYSLTGDGAKEIVLFEESAHYLQFEEEEAFYQWMKDTFRH